MSWMQHDDRIRTIERVAAVVGDVIFLAEC